MCISKYRVMQYKSGWLHNSNMLVTFYFLGANGIKLNINMVGFI